MASSSCPYITGANIGIKGLGFVLYKVQWQYTPLGEQSILVQYRKQGDVTWINVSTNQKVDAAGNLSHGSLIILSSAEQDTTYEVRFVNQCGSLEYIQTFLYSVNLFSDNYLLDSVLYNICGNDPVTAYSNQAFGVGATMYEDAQLSTELTGYNYIGLASGGTLYNINSGTGVVGSATAYSCRDSFKLKAMYGNNTGTICNSTIQTVYADGSVEVGIFVFTDAAMSIPLTGNDYIVFVGDLIIYTLNNATGEVTGTSGSSCTGYSNYYNYSKVISDIPDATPTKLFTPGSFGKGAIMYTDVAMTAALTTYNYISLNGVIRTINSTTGEVGCLAEEC